MVKKLMKYDFSAFGKTILPMEIILLGIAVLTRFLQFFENDSKIYNILNVSSIVLLIVAMIVCIVMTVAICVVRFYKNLYTQEGYLTLSLPATHAQHIISKLVTSVFATFISLISVILAGLIATLGDLSHEIILAFNYLVKLFFNMFKIHGAFFVLEAVIAAVVVIATDYLLLFACITIGQTAKKNRILASFGAFFAYYVITQIIGTVIIVIFNEFYDFIPFDAISRWIENHQYTFAHSFAAFFIVFNAALGLLYFAITKHIMKKKLNLE
ncbi:MAG: hypothetical protein PUB34_00055 [Clostridia bacterium]|nr:hypothetical protein [Clostridia bacterium]